MRTHTAPTHYVTVEIPLNQNATKELHYDAFQQALQVCLASSAAAFDSVICGDIQVSIRESP